MRQKDLEDCIVKKENKTEVVAVRVRASTLKALKKKGIDIPVSVRNMLERMAE